MYPESYDLSISSKILPIPAHENYASSGFPMSSKTLQHCLLSYPKGDDVISLRLKVKNEQGLHVRPATNIASIAARFTAQITFTYRKKTIDARSVLGILLLGASQNSTIVVHAVGKDAESALKAIQEAFSSEFRGAL